MKCYLVIVKAWTERGRLVMDNVLKVFFNKNNAEKYIKETWPEAHYRKDDYGECYVIEPDECSWKTHYFIREMNIEDL